MKKRQRWRYKVRERRRERRGHERRGYKKKRKAKLGERHSSWSRNELRQPLENRSDVSYIVTITECDAYDQTSPNIFTLSASAARKPDGNIESNSNSFLLRFYDFRNQVNVNSLRPTREMYRESIFNPSFTKKQTHARACSPGVLKTVRCRTRVINGSKRSH